MSNSSSPTGSRRGRRGASSSRLADALRRAVDNVDDEPSVSEGDHVEEEPTQDATAADTRAAYRIGEVAGLVGVDAHVLRYWESEFRLKPERSTSGQRVYRQGDLSRFLRIKSLLHDEGYTIAGARRVLEHGVDAKPSVDVARVKSALDRIQVLRDKILEARDQIELDLIHR